MRTSLHWLSQYTPGPMDPSDVAERFTHGGLNVDSITAIADDTILEVEVTSNRGDCLCHVGLARELAALQGRPFVEPAIAEPAITQAAKSPCSVHIAAPELCPHYIATVIRGVTVKPSPGWLQRRLFAVGLRPINNIVDITNFVLFELGQPLHAFDYKEQPVIVRQAQPNEAIQTLDGKTHRLQPPMLVIADPFRPVAVAGVMGGAATQVTEHTTDILLEAARFDPLSVRKTARALSMRSDSSYRFERGIDPTLPERASRRAAQLILELAGGQIEQRVVAGTRGYTARTLRLRWSELRRIVGVDFPRDRVLDILTRLHLEPKTDGDEAISVNVPSFRLDLNIETDLIEEIVRVIGLDQIPTRPELAIRLNAADPSATATDIVIRTLTGSGFYEAITFSFVSDSLRDLFLPESGSLPLNADPAVRKADATLRPSLLPGLLEAVRRNETNGFHGARLFEIGSSFLAHPDGSPDETRALAIVAAGDWRDLRGVIELMLNRLDSEKSCTFVPTSHVGYAPGACAQVRWGDIPVGIAGRTAAPVVKTLGLRESVVAAELKLDLLLSGARLVPQLHALPEFPAATRDLSLVVEDRLPFEQIDRGIREARLPDLESIDYVTTYRGKPLEPGKKSITVKLVFRSATTTLTGEQVESAVAGLSQSLQNSLGATLRT